MVAAKRGRGARNQAKAKQADPEVSAAPSAEPEQPTEETLEEQPVESEADAPENQQPEPSSENQAVEGNGAVDAESTEKASEKKEDKKEEPGRILVENLPTCLLFNFQEKMKEIFSIYGEINCVKRGPIIVTELTTTPTLSAIVEFKNKDSLEKAIVEDKSVVEGNEIAVSAQPSTLDTTVLVGVPFEASTEYVRLLFQECGAVAQVQEFSKTKYKILRVTFEAKECMERALKLDRELRINGFLVTVTKYREDDDGKQPQANNKNQNKRQVRTGQQQPPPQRNNNFRGRGGGGGAFVPRGGLPFRGTGGRGGGGRGGFGARGGGGGAGFVRGGGFANDYQLNSSYMPHAPFIMPRGGYLNDGQRPNKRMRNE